MCLGAWCDGVLGDLVALPCEGAVIVLHFWKSHDIRCLYILLSLPLLHVGMYIPFPITLQELFTQKTAVISALRPFVSRRGHRFVYIYTALTILDTFFLLYTKNDQTPASALASTIILTQIVSGELLNTND
jgi:hypothetical protein